MTTRRSFIKHILLSVPLLSLTPKWAMGRNRPLKFGWVTDIHYAKAQPKWNRYYDQSLLKLNEAVALFNSEGLDFAIETGDLKDQTEPPVEYETLEYLKRVEEEFAKFNGPRYHVLGNHDLDSLSKEQFMSVVKNNGTYYNDTYYGFTHNGFLVVVLDACFTKNGTSYHKGNFKWYDTAIPQNQLDWLKQILKKHCLPTIVFTHQLLDGKGNLYVKNASKIRKMLEESKQVVAVFQGHKHEGDYHQINNIHYITQKALVDGDGAAENSYSVVEITESKIEVIGYRKAQTHNLGIPSPAHPH